jgi:hypothetical protein
MKLARQPGTPRILADLCAPGPSSRGSVSQARHSDLTREDKLNETARNTPPSP